MYEKSNKLLSPPFSSPSPRWSVKRYSCEAREEEPKLPCVHLDLAISWSECQPTLSSAVTFIASFFLVWLLLFTVPSQALLLILLQVLIVFQDIGSHPYNVQKDNNDARTHEQNARKSIRKKNKGRCTPCQARRDTWIQKAHGMSARFTPAMMYFDVVRVVSVGCWGGGACRGGGEVIWSFIGLFDLRGICRCKQKNIAEAGQQDRKYAINHTLRTDFNAVTRQGRGGKGGGRQPHLGDIDAQDSGHLPHLLHALLIGHHSCLIWVGCLCACCTRSGYVGPIFEMSTILKSERWPNNSVF